MSYKVKGIIKRIGAVEEYGSNGFKKKTFAIETEEQYPQVIALELHGEKVSELDRYSEGMEITASFNLRGREWTNPQGEVKVFNTLQVWRIEGDAIPKTEQEKPLSEKPLDEDDQDDLPF